MKDTSVTIYEFSQSAALLDSADTDSPHSSPSPNPDGGTQGEAIFDPKTEDVLYRQASGASWRIGQMDEHQVFSVCERGGEVAREGRQATRLDKIENLHAGASNSALGEPRPGGVGGGMYQGTFARRIRAIPQGTNISGIIADRRSPCIGDLFPVRSMPPAQDLKHPASRARGCRRRPSLRGRPRCGHGPRDATGHRFHATEQTPGSRPSSSQSTLATHSGPRGFLRAGKSRTDPPGPAWRGRQPPVRARRKSNSALKGGCSIFGWANS